MADHRFILGQRVDEAIPDQWHRRWAACARCGDTRPVYHAIGLHHLNFVTGPCKPARWWRR